MRILHFSDLSLEQQTQALNLVYQDYTLPFTVSQAWVAEHLSAHQIDTLRSPLWMDSRGVIALALVAVRHRQAWIGGFGIAPAYRGNRFSQPLLQACLKDLDVESVQLEVLLGNHKAQATYRRGGFETTRQLAVLEGPPGPPSLAVQPSGSPCWQRQPASLAALPGLQRANQIAYRDNILYEVNTGSRWCDLPPVERWRVSNEPVDSPLYAQLLQLGWKEVARQWEMVKLAGTE